MSVKRDRYRKAVINSDYRKLYLSDLYPPYWDEDYSWSRSGHKFPNYKWRSYKTWKHNRKTKYKT